jgi:hypothetical protein
VTFDFLETFDRGVDHAAKLLRLRRHDSRNAAVNMRLIDSRVMSSRRRYNEKPRLLRSAVWFRPMNRTNPRG